MIKTSAGARESLIDYRGEGGPTRATSITFFFESHAVRYENTSAVWSYLIFLLSTRKQRSNNSPTQRTAPSRSLFLCVCVCRGLVAFDATMMWTTSSCATASHAAAAAAVVVVVPKRKPNSSKNASWQRQFGRRSGPARRAPASVVTAAGAGAAAAGATEKEEKDDEPPLKVWEGGGDGIVAPVDQEAMGRLEARWEETSWDLESRWELAKQLFLMERNRVGLGEDWKVRVGRCIHATKMMLLMTRGR